MAYRKALSLVAAALSLFTFTETARAFNPCPSVPTAVGVINITTGRYDCVNSTSATGGGGVTPGSTNYIQNTANPTTATQVFFVSSGTVGPGWFSVFQTTGGTQNTRAVFYSTFPAISGGAYPDKVGYLLLQTKNNDTGGATYGTDPYYSIFASSVSEAGQVPQNTDPELRMSARNNGSNYILMLNGNNQISVSSSIINMGNFATQEIKFNAYDCTGKLNGGKITALSGGALICSDDTSGGGGGANISVEKDGVSIVTTSSITFKGTDFGVTSSGGKGSVTLNLSTSSTGATGFIFNQNTLQSGATAYPSFTQVGTSLTVNGQSRFKGISNFNDQIVGVGATLSSATIVGNDSTPEVMTLDQNLSDDPETLIRIKQNGVLKAYFGWDGGTTGDWCCGVNSNDTSNTPVLGVDTLNHRVLLYSGYPFLFHDSRLTGGYVGFVSSANVTGNNTYVWMPSSGTAGQAIVTDGKNNLSFASVAGSVSLSTFTAGATNYIFNQLPLQAGATAHPSFLIVESSANFPGFVRISSGAFGTTSRYASPPTMEATTDRNQDINLYSVAMHGFNDTADDSVGGKGGGFKWTLGPGGNAQGGNSGTGGDGGDFVVVVATAGSGIDQAGEGGKFLVEKPNGDDLFLAQDGYCRIANVGVPVLFDVYANMDVIGTENIQVNNGSTDHTPATPLTLKAKTSTAAKTGFGITLPLYASQTTTGSETILWDITAVWVDTTSSVLTGKTTFNLRNGSSVEEVMRFTAENGSKSVNIGSQPVTFAKLSVFADSNTWRGLVIKSTSNPTKNALEITDNNDVVKSSVTWAGVYWSNGKRVCLEDGTNCSATGGGVSVYNATATIGAALGINASTITVSTLTITSTLNLTSIGLFNIGGNTVMHITTGAVFTTDPGSTATFKGVFLDSTSSAGTLGQVWTSNGALGSPTWKAATGSGSSTVRISSFTWSWPAAQASFNVPASSTPFIVNSTNSASAAIYFDEVSTQAAVFVTMLNNYYGGQLAADIIYTSSATTGTVNWGVYVECDTPGDALSYDTDSYSTINSTSVSLGSTSNMPMLATAVLTNGDSCANGDVVKIKLERTAGVNDTAVGYAKERVLRLYEQ